MTEFGVDSGFGQFVRRLSVVFGYDGSKFDSAIVEEGGSDRVFKLADSDGGLLAALNGDAWRSQDIFATLGVLLSDRCFDKQRWGSRGAECDGDGC